MSKQTFRTDTHQNVIPITPPVEDKQYLHTTQAGVGVPFAQTLITGVFVFAGVYLVGWLGLEITDPLKPAVILAVAVMIGTWGWRLVAWDKLVRHMEKVTGLELDGKPNEPETVRINLNRVMDGRNGPHYSASQVDLPASSEQLITMAKMMHNGIHFAEKDGLCPVPFSSTQFRNLRTVMLKRGLCGRVSEKDARQGYALTPDGWSIMDHFDPDGAEVQGEVMEEE